MSHPRPRPLPSRVRLATRSALALSVGAVAWVVGCGPARPGAADTTALGKALRDLRRSVVGERSTPETVGARAVRARRAVVDPRSQGGSPPHAHGTTADSAAPYQSDSARIPATPDTAYGDPAEWPTRVIRFTTTTAAPLTLWVGDTIALPVPPAPEGTPPSIERDLRWSSVVSAVATVSPRGVLTARAPGTAEIIAWRRVGQTVTPVEVRAGLRGRVVAADDVPLRARVIARVGSWADTLWTGPGGWFVFRPERALEGSATLRVDPADGATHSAALLVDTPLERLADVDVVLLPTRWRVTAGSYAGTTVDIDPSIASSRMRDALRLWHLARTGRAGPDAGQAVGWAAERLPLPLAFDHAARGGPIGGGDSVAFWRAARQLERDLGMSLFVPATLRGGDEGFGGIVVTLDPRIRAEGLTTTGWNGDGDLYDAVVAMRARALLADPGIVTHELLHALGVGHAPYGLRSVMHPVADASSPTHASADDVAYAQLLYAVRARSRAGRTLVGIGSADEGTRGR